MPPVQAYLCGSYAVSLLMCSTKTLPLFHGSSLIKVPGPGDKYVDPGTDCRPRASSYEGGGGNFCDGGGFGFAGGGVGFGGGGGAGPVPLGTTVGCGGVVGG
eukprot:3685905-Amphidinium_carterae.1